MLETKPNDSCTLLNDVSIDDAIMSSIDATWDQITCTDLGDSSWSWPLRVVLTKGDSVVMRYFIKIAKSELGMSMLRGEYVSMSLLHSIVPDNAVRPIAWGRCSSQPDCYFYISDYFDFLSVQPDLGQFSTMVAKFHQDSAQLFERGEIRPKPLGNFGFHITTHMGAFPLDNEWSNSWEEFFGRGMRRILSYEVDTQGPSEELDHLTAKLLEKVVPRLLRPMETCGRSIRPTLIHGDLQIRNVKKDKETHNLVMFDAGSFWGHGECDLGKWRPKRFSIGRQYMDEYHLLVPKTEPADDWEDRNILYSIRCNLLSSVHYPGDSTLRQLALEDIRYLVNKYPDGYNADDYGSSPPT